MESKLGTNQASVIGGLSYLPAKQLLMLQSLQQIGYFAKMKIEGKSIEKNPQILDELITTRLILEKLRPLDSKLQYQIDKLSKLATTSQQFEDDLLQHKPRPELLEKTLTAEEQAAKPNKTKSQPQVERSSFKPDVYHPAKINPVHFEV